MASGMRFEHNLRACIIPGDCHFGGKSKAILLNIFILCLLPFLTFACLTTQSSKAPAFRGLKPSEAAKLESLNDNSWENHRPSSPAPAKEETPENLADMAEFFLQSGDYEKSIYNYSKMLSQQPHRLDVRYKLGLALLLSGKVAEAKKELAEILLHKMDMLEAHEALGLVYLQENNLPLAQQEFRSILAQEPNRFQARYFLGESYLRSKQYSLALPEFRAALEIAPRSSRVMSALGWTCFKLKNYDQSLQWLKKAQSISPNDSKLNHRLGMVLAEQKKFPEALEAFRKAGDEAQAFNNIGVHYYLDHRYNEAARCFQKALELRPTFYEEAKGNLDKALSRLQEDHVAVSDQPDRPLQEISLNKN